MARRKKFEKPEGQIQVSIVDKPDEIEKIEEKEESTDVELEKTDPVEATSLAIKTYEPAFKVFAKIYVLKKKGRLKIITDIDLKNVPKDLEMNLTERDMAHWVNMMQKSIFVMGKGTPS